MPIIRTKFCEMTTSMKKYQGTYRIPSARADWWNYAWNAVYFVTICTKGRRHHFGKVSDGEMSLSEIGHVAQLCWLKIPEHFPFVRLGEFVIMPDHLHGIIIIKGDTIVRNSLNGGGRLNIQTDPDGGGHSETPVLTGPNGGGHSETPVLTGPNGGGHSETPVLTGPNGGGHSETPVLTGPNGGGHSETQDFASLRERFGKLIGKRNLSGNKFGPQSKNLASIIRGYKSGVTMQARQINPDFGWQPRYHDRIVRDADELARITKYIIENPENWTGDEFFQ